MSRLKTNNLHDVNLSLKGSSVCPFLAVWTDLIEKTPHFLPWFWCDVSLALTPSWTLWELLGIGRPTGVFELGDLIECSCHNISNTVYSPIMTQLGSDGTPPKKRRGGAKRKSTWSAVKCLVFVFLFFTVQPPFASANLITENYFSSRSFNSAPFVCSGSPPSIPNVLHCINLQYEPQLGILNHLHQDRHTHGGTFGRVKEHVLHLYASFIQVTLMICGLFGFYTFVGKEIVLLKTGSLVGHNI